MRQHVASVVRSSALLMVALAAAVQPGAQADDLSHRISVVFDADNLPYSSQRGRPAGLNVDLARLIASEMNARLKIEWVDTETQGLLSFLVGEDGEQPVQLAVGVPLEPRTVEDEVLVGPEVLFSDPLASTGYVLVTRSEHVRVPSFRALRRVPLAVEQGSVASMSLWDKGFIVRGFPSQKSILEALLRNELQYGVLWSNAGWLIERDEGFRGLLTVSAAVVDVAGLNWDLAVAVSKAHAYLLPKVNKALRALREAKAFEPVFEFYHVPFSPALNQEG